MSNHIFAVGDQVKFVGKGAGPTNRIGKVVALDAGPTTKSGEKGKPVGVEFRERVSLGHSCDGAGKLGYCWWCLDEELKKSFD